MSRFLLPGLAVAGAALYWPAAVVAGPVPAAPDEVRTGATIKVPPPPLYPPRAEVAESAPSPWHFTLGAGVSVAPAYEGSDRYQANPVPFAELTWNERVTIGVGHASVTVYGGEVLQFGPTIAYRAGRRERDDRDLRGMGDVKDAVDVGGFVTLALGDWRAGLSVAGDVTGQDLGSTAQIGIGRDVPLGRHLHLALDANAVWASADYMAANFGVTDRQSRASGMARYTAEAGIKDVGLTGMLAWELSDSWTLVSSTDYRRLVGSAADSPLVKDRGSADQWSQTLVLTYSF